jgi:hypothetical protein
MEDMQKRSTAALGITNRLSAMMVPIDHMMGWGHYLMSCFHQVHPTLWDEFQDESLALMREFMTRSRVLREAEEKKNKDKPQEEVDVEIVIVADPEAVPVQQHVPPVLCPVPLPQQEVSPVP